MAPWQSLAARQDLNSNTTSLDPNLTLTAAIVSTTIPSSSLVFDPSQTFESATVTSLDPTLASIAALPTIIPPSSLVFDTNQTAESTIAGMTVPSITVTVTKSSTSTTPTVAFMSTPKPKPSSSDSKKKLGLSLPAIIGLAVGIFVLLAALLILFMCLRNRKSKAKPRKDKSWKTRMEQKEREKSFGPTFMPLEVSLPDVEITNPFRGSPDSHKVIEDNTSEDSHAGPVLLGSAVGVRTTEVKSMDMEEQKHVALSTPTLSVHSNPFIFSSDSPGGKSRPPLKAQERESTQSDYLDLRIDDFDSSTRPSYDSSIPSASPTILQFPMPSTPRQANFNSLPGPRSAQPPNQIASSTELELPPVAVLLKQRYQRVASRPSFQALITALEAPSAETSPISQISYETGITTNRISHRSSYMRTRMILRPPGLPVMDENRVFSTDRPISPKSPRGTPLILRRISKVDVDPRTNSVTDAFERSTSPISFTPGSPSRPPSTSTTATLVARPTTSISNGDNQTKDVNNNGHGTESSNSPSVLKRGRRHDSQQSTIESPSVYSRSSVYSNISEETVTLAR
ncbi:hypothetical protein M422DRAFT_250529 [Sphaerobolus stellatus SS14]|uniref:Uncharacterized protein n=1 Tax=Sphaerobolus stellatus (strain SS14) TaxID=990650 RepID=A0A0C9VTZ3_SPHS4|nr:hypothetical protein M422DRAFT_250529 [Sphaerobolus stellatus SS14]